MSASVPTLWLVAGANGVGKTTYAFRYIRDVAKTVNFVNLDEIARGLSPLDPPAAALRASRVAIALIHDMIASRRSFSLETTIAGRTHLRTIAAAKAAGFRVHLLYFAVRNVDICLARIARRVAEGGHLVEEPDVRRRFDRSIGQFANYAREADLWRVLDNNNGRPVAAAEGRQSCRSLLDDERKDALPLPLLEALRRMPPCTENA